MLFLPIVVIGLTLMLLRNSLPSITATHWSDSSVPDGFTTSTVFFTATMTMAILGGIVGWAALFLTRKPMVLLGMLFVGSLTAWTAAGIYISSSVPTALAGDPTQAVAGPWIFASIAATLIGLAPLWICGVFQQYQRNHQDKRRAGVSSALKNPAAQTTETATLPATGADFNETMNGPWWLWLLGLFMLGMGIFMLFFDSPEPGETLVSLIGGLVMVLVLTPMVLGLARIRVTVKDGKLRVASGIFGFAFRSIDAAQIYSVHSEEISPMLWGGWGWRFFPGGSAVVLKKHEGIVVELKNKKRFAVTIGNSAQGAARMHALTSSR